MIKRKIHICFLFLACFLQLGHSLFPHTHETEHHHHHGNSHHHHDDDDHSNGNGLSHFFSHFSHSSDTFSTTHTEDVSKIVKKVQRDLLVFDNPSIYNLSLTFYNKIEVVRNKEPLIFISPHLHSLQFRGPPTLFS